MELNEGNGVKWPQLLVLQRRGKERVVDNLKDLAASPTTSKILLYRSQPTNTGLELEEKKLSCGVHRYLNSLLCFAR